MLTTEQVAVGSTGPGPSGPRRPRRLPAAVLGLLSAILALAVPFLPVQQDTAQLRWPTAANGTAPVTAPLVALRPERLVADVGCGAVRALDARSPLPATVVSTTPPTSPDGVLVGLQVAVDGGNLTVTNRGQELASAPVPAGDCVLQVRSDASGTSVLLGESTLVTQDGDQRPQVVGVYSDLDGARDPLAGTAVRIDVDNRFDSSPGALKTTAGVLSVLALLESLWLLHRADEDLGRRAPRLRLHHSRAGDRLRDASVVGVLGIWAVLGGQTADDGYILSMVRGADSAGYVGNYYRWFDVPEAPFGWFYELYAIWAGLSDSILWLRLPAFAIGVASWFLVSRALLPRLGRGVRVRHSATWAAAAVFLCFWLPYNNGLRPEPVVVLCALLALTAVERGLVTRRLVPLGLGLVAAAFAVAATPTGLMAAAPFLAAARPITMLLRDRAAAQGWFAVLAPLGAAGLVVLVAVFGDQPVGAVLEATRVRTEIGPNLSWFAELSRYTLLFAENQDGSVGRRFPVLLLLVCTAVAVVMLLRRGRIPGAATGPVQRLIGVTVLGFAVLALTPTKWTHHFGAFAALGAGTVAVAVVAASATGLRSRRNQALFLATLLATTALAFTAPNTAYYASNWGIPWWDRPPGIGGVSASGVLLAATGVLLALAAVEHVRGPTARPRTGGRTLGAGGGPLAILCGLMVVFQIGSFGLAVRAQDTGYTLATDIAGDPTGAGCGLSGRVLVETSPAAGLLPAAPDPGPVVADGFGPDGLPPTGPGSRRDTDGEGDRNPAVRTAVPGGMPRLGSWSAEAEATGDLRTAWFSLPPTARWEQAPLVVGAAGDLGDGTSLTLEFGAGQRVVERVDLAGVPAVTATADPSGSAASGRGWRDLRVDLTERPDEADQVRIVAKDRALSPEGWLAVTPPRVPQLVPLTELVGRAEAGDAAPGFLDWPTALPNPCLRQFDVRHGVAEVPDYRLLADPQQRANGESWSAPPSGGPQGWLGQTARQYVAPSYVLGEFGRDWGQIRLLEPYSPAAAAPELVRGTRTVWGLDDPGPIGAPPAGRPTDAR